jgi:hypothetical protein
VERSEAMKATLPVLAVLHGKRGMGVMADRHQVNSIIATALCEVGKDHPDHWVDPEEAKQIAKCIVEALTNAGMQIVPVDQS